MILSTQRQEQGRARLGDVVNVVVSLFRYVMSGTIIVDLCRWLVTTGGTIAESAFLLATVYVTINNVAHLILTWILPLSTIATLNQVSIIAFSVLPELIVASAIKVTLDHWRMFGKVKKWYSVVWAIAYTLPTLIFIVMTVITLASFVSVEAASSTAVSPQATGTMLVTRCLAGWTYGLVQMLFATIGKKTYSAHFDEVTTEHQEIVSTLAESGRSLRETLSQKEADILALREQVTTLQEQMSLQEIALQDARMSLATRKVTRHRNVSETQDSGIAESDTSEHDTSETPIVIGEKRARLKEHMQSAILSGNKMNLKRIAADANVSYGMARKHAETLLREITQELPRKRA